MESNSIVLMEKLSNARNFYATPIPLNWLVFRRSSGFLDGTVQYSGTTGDPNGWLRAGGIRGFHIHELGRRAAKTFALVKYNDRMLEEGITTPMQKLEYRFGGCD